MKKKKIAHVDKTAQLVEMNGILKGAGFAYSSDGDYFYSLHECWQRECGYCRLYDDNMHHINIITQFEPIEFEYDDRRWLIELWKGQYGITTGAEIGVYVTDCPDVFHEKFTGTFYEAVDDDEMLPLSYKLRRKGKVILERSDTHWWLTGFKLGVFSHPRDLTLDASITFPNEEMRDAFTAALIKKGYSHKKFKVTELTVTVHYTRPYTHQHGLITTPDELIRDGALQLTNKNNVGIFNAVTARHANSLDKIGYIRSLAPWLFDFMLESMYGRGLYSGFRWLLDFVFDRGCHKRVVSISPSEIIPLPHHTEPVLDATYAGTPDCGETYSTLSVAGVSVKLPLRLPPLPPGPRPDPRMWMSSPPGPRPQASELPPTEPTGDCPPYFDTMEEAKLAGYDIRL